MGELWSAVRTGQKPLEFQAESDLEEAQFVAEKVASLLREGKYSATDIAVLYRMNSQSRVLENKLKERGIPYAIYGGQSFYERKEIKDVLAYLNLLVNPSADLCFARGAGAAARYRRSVAGQTICGGAGKARFADAYVPRGG